MNYLANMGTLVEKKDVIQKQISETEKIFTN